MPITLGKMVIRTRSSFFSVTLGVFIQRSFAKLLCQHIPSYITFWFSSVPWKAPLPALVTAEPHSDSLCVAFMAHTFVQRAFLSLQVLRKMGVFSLWWIMSLCIYKNYFFFRNTTKLISSVKFTSKVRRLNVVQWQHKSILFWVVLVPLPNSPPAGVLILPSLSWWTPWFRSGMGLCPFQQHWTVGFAHCNTWNHAIKVWFGSRGRLISRLAAARKWGPASLFQTPKCKFQLLYFQPLQSSKRTNDVEKTPCIFVRA